MEKSGRFENKYFKIYDEEAKLCCNLFIKFIFNHYLLWGISDY